VREPPPQVIEHDSQVAHWLVVQSTGQLKSLHVCWTSVVGHVMPPKSDTVVTTRERDCEPAPHVVVHWLQVAH
jgi:hypothetical protein